MENGTDSSTKPPLAAPATATTSAPESNVKPSAQSASTAVNSNPTATSEQANKTASKNDKANPAKIQSKSAGRESQAEGKAKESGGEAGGTGKLSPADLKKQAKSEKQARRAKAKQLLEQTSGGAHGPTASGSTETSSPVTGSKKGQQAGGKEAQRGQRQGGVVSGRRGSMAALGMTTGTGNAAAASAAEVKKREDKNVAVFGHLYGTQRRSTIAGAGKEVHPAVLALGLQIRDYVICGSSARCVATLLAFKRVIESYTTPLGTSLSRHLTTHLSHQITYLSTCRPLSISQGNAIRALKLFISSIDPSVPEEEAKSSLCDFIDSFIREKITVADQVIASSAAQKIQNGDVIVTFAGSSIVKQTLLTAHKQGKKFRVSIIDSRPLFEGMNLARALANAGLEVQYSLIHGISHALKDATKVFLGAHAMTGNGRLYSRVGTALVAMSAKERSGGVEIPVIVCCETVKFTDRVALDSIVVNELADADELVPTHATEQVTGIPDPTSSNDQGSNIRVGGNKNVKKPNTPSAAESLESLSLSQQAPSPLKSWRDTPHLQLLNIMYDVTPAEYVDMVVTEMGSLPPSAVPVVHRMSTNS